MPLGDDRHLVVKVDLQGIEEVNRHLKKMQDDGTKAATMIETSFQKVSKGIKVGFTDAWKSIAGGVTVANLVTNAVMGAGRAVTTYLKDSVAASNEYEKSINDLTAALQSQGNYTAANIKIVNDYSSALATKMGIDDESTRAVAAQIEALTSLSGEALPAAIQATVSLANVMKIDLDSAGAMVAKALLNETDTLGRLKLDLKDARTDTDKLAIMNKALAGGWQMAEKDANTYEGQLRRLAEAEEDTKVKTGELVKEIDTKLLPLKYLINDFVLNFVEGIEDIGQGMTWLMYKCEGVSVAALKAIGSLNGVSNAPTPSIPTTSTNSIMSAVDASIAGIFKPTTMTDKELNAWATDTSGYDDLRYKKQPKTGGGGAGSSGTPASAFIGPRVGGDVMSIVGGFLNYGPQGKYIPELFAGESLSLGDSPRAKAARYFDPRRAEWQERQNWLPGSEPGARESALDTFGFNVNPAPSIETDTTGIMRRRDIRNSRYMMAAQGLASGDYAGMAGGLVSTITALGAWAGPAGAAVSLVASLLLKRKPHEQITEPIPVKVANFSDMASALLAVTKGALTMTASRGIDRLEGLKAAQAATGVN